MNRSTMATAASIFSARKGAAALISRAANSAPNRRYAHTHTLWEQLLGRKIDASSAKKLEDAFLEYRVRKSVPSWLPFMPNCSFWIPSSEDTIKNLLVIAERLKVSKSAPKEPPAWPSGSNQGNISKVAEWSLIHQTDKLLSRLSSTSSSSDIALKPLADQGSIIQVSLGEEHDDEDDTDSEEELEVVVETKKPEDK